MESTGVYWIPLFEILEQRGIRPCLVNARHMKNVPGRRTDWYECQWLQYLAFRRPAPISLPAAVCCRRGAGSDPSPGRAGADGQPACPAYAQSADADESADSPC